MNTNLLKIFSVIGILILGHSVEADDKIKDDNINKLAAKYKKLTDEQEKLQFCIKIINDKIIALGAPVNTVDKIFGTDLGKNLPSKEEKTNYLPVEFGRQPPPFIPPNSVLPRSFYEEGGQRPFIGWELMIKYDYDGIIVGYYLTNTHEMRQP